MKGGKRDRRERAPDGAVEAETDLPEVAVHRSRHRTPSAACGHAEERERRSPCRIFVRSVAFTPSTKTCATKGDDYQTAEGLTRIPAGHHEYENARVPSKRRDHCRWRLRCPLCSTCASQSELYRSPCLALAYLLTCVLRIYQAQEMALGLRAICVFVHLLASSISIYRHEVVVVLRKLQGVCVHILSNDIALQVGVSSLVLERASSARQEGFSIGNSPSQITFLPLSPDIQVHLQTRDRECY